MEIQGLDELLNILDSSIKGFDVEIPKTLSKISIYLASKPFYYSSHSETLLSYKERAENGNSRVRWIY